MMAIRKNSAIERTLAVDNLRTPADVRRFLLAEWAKESAGEKYRYFVKVLEDGKRIYLERPGRLNKGCDFVIFVEDLFLHGNGHDKPPSHEDLLADLPRKKQRLHSESWRHLYDALEAVHGMTFHEIPFACKREINALAPMNLEQILLLCKWFFIEQDMTYWSGKGRDMLWEGIQSIGR